MIFLVKECSKYTIKKHKIQMGHLGHYRCPKSFQNWKKRTLQIMRQRKRVLRDRNCSNIHGEHDLKIAL